MTAIKTIKIDKKYRDVHAVKEVDLEVGSGEIFGLLGVNGAGKTTMIKMLTGLCEPDGGEAYINGLSIRDDAERIKEISNSSPQETAIAPNLTVFENLEMMAGIYGANRVNASAAALDTIAELGLQDVKTKRAGKLSGGWQRRLSIAMALISKPQILYLDEPTLGLDVLARRELWKVIEQLKGKITIILTTHYLEEAQALCDRIAIMAEGTVHAVGTADELIALSGKNTFEDAFVEIASGGKI